MRTITPILTPELERHVASAEVAKAPPFPLASYRELVEHTAKLAYLNKDHLLFFRGQERDYTNKAGASSFYPSIYREDNLRREELAVRFGRLDRAAQQLRELFVRGQIEGHLDVARKRMVQWSVLQHYGVCDTPLLDFTQSPRVACSFAMKPGGDKRALVFVFGLPYLTNRISFNSEQDTVIVRLLSICPPTALRPYFQEGYLAGTSDVTTEYDNKNELDFNHRLIAKFSIPNGNRFWGTGLRGLSADELYPLGDGMKDLCGLISLDDVRGESAAASAIGAFIAAWAGLERLIMRVAQRQQERIPSIVEAIRILRRETVLGPSAAAELEELRRMRNAVVHGQDHPAEAALRAATAAIASVRSELQAHEKRERASGPSAS